MSRSRIVIIVVIIAAVLAFVSAPSSLADTGPAPYQAATTTYLCAISVASGLTVHVVDAKGMPVSDAMVLLNGTYVCNGQTYPSNFSGTTDSDGNAAFSVVPYAKYNVTVIPPRNTVGENIAISRITAPEPTMFATATISVPEFPISSALTIVVAFGSVTVAIIVMRERKRNGC